MTADVDTLPAPPSIPAVGVRVEVRGSEELEKLVEEDLRMFEAWFRAKGNDPLVRSERAILKTYLWFKVKGETDATSGT